MNIAVNLVVTAERFGDAPAVRLDGDVWTYRALDAASARLAAVLRERGVRPGDRVGLMLPNVPEFAVVYYGILRAGAIVVPMNPLLKKREVAYYLGDSGARLLFAWHGCAEEAEAGAQEAGTTCLFAVPGEFGRLLAGAAPEREVSDRAAADTAVILYTSGTTGQPKGAELTHGNLRSNIDAVVALHGFDPATVTLGALPLFHSFGQTCSLNATVAAAGCLTLLSRFDAEKALSVVERDGVTIFQGVPTMYSAMLGHPRLRRYDVSTLDHCVSGGAPLPVEVLHGIENAFGCRVLEGYGLSETSPVASSHRLDRERKPGSIGWAIDGVEMRVVDDSGALVPLGEVGEIVVRGPNVMKGYWQRPEATAEAIDPEGWFHTGDLARMDADGYFYIVDRKKDLIIRGGYNVYPREVEEVLYQHPAVREAAVVGVPHASLGEEVAAVVAVSSPVEPGDLSAWVKDRIAPYKYPRLVEIVDELPKGPTGKILKREIRLDGAPVRGERFARGAADAAARPRG